MKKLLFLVTVMLVSGLSSGQTGPKEKDFPVRYSLKVSKDTVSAHLKNNLGFKSRVYSPYLWIDRMTLISDAGSQITVRESDLDYLEITDHEGTVRKLVMPAVLSKLNLNLVEVNYEGKMSLYTDYYVDNRTRKLIVDQYLAEEGEKAIKVGFYGRGYDSAPGFKKYGELNIGFFNSFRKDLKKRLTGYPDLLDRVVEMKTYDDLMFILSEYNKK
jgi:hypothetical protein